LAASPTPFLAAAFAAAPVQFGVLIEGSDAAAAGQIAARSGLVAIRAPMLGTFYRSPAPGEPPYVQPGDVVDEKFTIGLIDVMKLFTQIPAGMAGRVVEIVAQDATLVEHGQPLVFIEPL
jgi:acetyl-CoA carboxylase biotin carboxyl carrier protein